MYIFLIIIALLIPILLFFLQRKRAVRKMERDKAIELKIAFNQLSRKYKLSIDEVEIFNNKVIGLDRKNSKFIWIEYIGSSLSKNCILLNELESHRIRKTSDKIEGSTKKIVMEFNFINRKPAYFVFYDSSSDNISALTFLQDKAKYWDAKIHVHMNAYYSIHEFEYVL